MSSQFVDIDGDGQRDILVGSFEGVPFLIRGSQQGYLPAERILDENNETVLLSAFWNRETNKWDTSDRAGVEGHCTSAHAVDWTGNGVMDLLVGARALWQPEVKPLSEAQLAEKERLQESAREMDQQFSELALERRRIQEETEDQDVEAKKAAVKPLVEQLQKLSTDRRQVQLRLTEIGAGGPKQGDFVWWFPRK